MCVCLSLSLYVYVYIYIYIYIHNYINTYYNRRGQGPLPPRRQDAPLHGVRAGARGHDLTTVGFHNFDLRIFNLGVSNPNELIVDVFLTRCRI